MLDKKTLEKINKITELLNETNEGTLVATNYNYGGEFEFNSIVINAEGVHLADVYNGYDNDSYEATMNIDNVESIYLKKTIKTKLL